MTKHNIDDSLFFCDSDRVGSIVYKKTCDICVDKGSGYDDGCMDREERNGQVVILVIGMKSGVCLLA